MRLELLLRWVSVTGEGVQQLEDVTVQHLPPRRQLLQESLHAKIMESLQKTFIEIYNKKFKDIHSSYKFCTIAISMTAPFVTMMRKMEVGSARVHMSECSYIIARCQVFRTTQHPGLL